MNTWLLSEARRTALNADRQLPKSKKLTKKIETPSPDDELKQYSQRPSTLELGVSESSLQEPSKLFKILLPNELVVYNYNGKEGLKGRILNQVDEKTYLVQPINKNEPPLNINEDDIIYIDHYERKGGKTKRNKKRGQRKTKRNKKRAKTNKKQKKGNKKRKTRK